MNAIAQIEAIALVPGLPLLDDWSRPGFIVTVRAAGRGEAMIGAAGFQLVTHSVEVLMGDSPVVQTVPGNMVERWAANAARAEMPMIADHAERAAAAGAARSAAFAASQAQAAADKQDRAEFEAAHVAAIPADAKAVIYAEFMRDESDGMTDYFGGRTERTVILGFSKHTRDLFPELRKAALNYAETAFLADAPDSAEHREKYSMGGGFYLSKGGRYSGWQVRKRSLNAENPARSIPSGEWAVPSGEPAPVVAGPVAVGGIRIEEHTHTKRGFQMFICILPGRVDREEFDRLRNAAEALGGWYSKPWSKTPGGFAFKARTDAEAFSGAQPSEAGAPAAEVAPRVVPGIADKLRTLADKLQGDIDHKLGNRLTNTPKRQREAASARHEGTRLQRTQKAMRALANLHDAGTVPPLLARLATKAAIYDLAGSHIDRSNAGYYDAGIDTGKPAKDTPEALALWELIGGPSEADRRADDLRRKLEALQFAKIPGFFPTPAAVIAGMLDAADIGNGPVTILEPSAGSGAILDAVHKAHPDALLYSCEVHQSLREVLKLKGYQPQYTDFMEVEAEPIWDFVLMNPPFENGQDMAHVRHAFDMLKPGGRLVAIMSPGPFYRQDRKAQEFRDWFDDLAGDKTDIAAGAFKESGTGVATVMVVLDKAAAPAEAAPEAPKRATRWGTSHFASIATARAYYARQGEDAAAVLDKLKEGAISIGEPTAKPGERVTLDRDEGRYFIEA
jgi:hypothetical protein